MACEKPATIKQMINLRALSPRQADMYGCDCQKAIDEAVNLPHGDLPSYPKTRRPKKDGRVLRRIQQLKKKREAMSMSLGMEPGILLNNAMITAISVNNPETTQTLLAIDGIRKWQAAALGDSIMKVLGHS